MQISSYTILLVRPVGASQTSSVEDCRQRLQLIRHSALCCAPAYWMRRGLLESAGVC
jgi:hypothetical protein